MKKMWLIALGVIAAVFMMIAGFYNNLVVSREKVDTQWAQVQTQYQRRFDLIPNLVETVKGVAKQEQDVFGKIADARTKYGAAQTTEDKVAAANELETSLSRLLVIVENYPTLKSSESYQTLMTQLEGTENRVSVERQRYNEVVRDYNLVIKRFPANIMAGMFGFTAKTYFGADTAAQTAPQVNFK
jgi:LemA protein